MVTVVCFGLYGNFLHSGQMGMADPVHGRYKAFLFVGLAYFLVAVLAPLAILVMKGATLKFTAKGMGVSLIAGSLGAVGAFGILLAFGAKGTPAVVMSIVFAGAPIINAFASIVMHPPAGGWTSIRWQFFIGIILAALGGCLVTYYKPNPPMKKPVPVASAHATAPSGSGSGSGSATTDQG